MLTLVVLSASPLASVSVASTAMMTGAFAAVVALSFTATDGLLIEVSAVQKRLTSGVTPMDCGAGPTGGQANTVALPLNLPKPTKSCHILL